MMKMFCFFKLIAKTDTGLHFYFVQGKTNCISVNNKRMSLEVIYPAR